MANRMNVKLDFTEESLQVLDEPGHMANVVTTSHDGVALVLNECSVNRKSLAILETFGYNQAKTASDGNRQHKYSANSNVGCFFQMGWTSWRSN